MNIDDVWAGRVSARHVAILTQNLVLNPHSRVFAIRGGSPELQGWDTNTVVAVRTHNLILSLIQGLSGEHDPDGYIDYPGATEEVTQPMTLAELTAERISAFFDG